MYVNSRLLKVLEFLKENSITSIKEISEKLNITDREIRYDIEILNFLLEAKRLPQIKKESKGKLILDKSLINNSQTDEFYKLNKYSKEERIELIKVKLLLEGNINLSAISKNLDVSRTSIRNDLNEISKELEKLGMMVSQNSLHEDERVIRNYLMKTYSQRIMKYYFKNNDFDANLLDDYFAELLMEINRDKIKEYIKKLLCKTNNRNQNYYTEIWSYTIISYLRIKFGFTISYVKNQDFIKNSEYYKEINSYLDSLELILEIGYSQEERLYFSERIIGLLNYNYNVDILENWIDVVLITKKMIENVAKYSGVDIQSDESLINGLLNHIKPAITRLKNNIIMEHDIYMDVIEPYQELFHLVKESLTPLEKIINKEIVPAEIALITLHFLAAIERNRLDEVKKKTVLLVCGGGYGTSILVAKQINNLYNVEIKETIYYAEFLDYNLEEIDVVITTLNLKEGYGKNKDIPIIKISPFLTVEDQKILGKYLFKNGFNKTKLNEILEIVNECVEIKDLQQLASRLELALINKSNIKKRTTQLRLLDWISEEKIKVVDKIESWQDSIKVCGESLIKANKIREAYVTEIIDIANNFGVHFILDNGVAIPHGEVGKNVNESAISILYVKEPVIFPEGKEAKIFFLIAAKTTKDHVKSIEDIISFVSHKEYVDEVLKANTESELLLRLENIFYKYIY